MQDNKREKLIFNRFLFLISHINSRKLKELAKDHGVEEATLALKSDNDDINSTSVLYTLGDSF